MTNSDFILAASKKTKVKPLIPSSTKHYERKNAEIESFWKKVGRFISFSPKEKEKGVEECPLSEDFAYLVASGKLLETPIDAENHIKNKCATESPYAKESLDEIVLIHKELSEMRKLNPKEPSLKKDGGGYNMERLNRGLKVQIPLSETCQVPANPSGKSHCSGALFTHSARLLFRVNQASASSKMSQKQLDNFIPRKISEVIAPKDSKGRAISPEKNILDQYGYYGIVNNDGNGIRDVGDAFRKHKAPISRAVNEHFSGPKKFDNFCAGDWMQWDRPGGGHSGVYLGRVKGKMYFWSSNTSTGGYGVTCEPEANLMPKGERLMSPENIAAIPEFNGEQLFGASKKTTKWFPERITPPTFEVKRAEVMDEGNRFVEEGAKAEHTKSPVKPGP